MERTKRKRLEAQGWRFGSAADFLDLSPEDSAIIELRLRLSDALKERRQTAKLSQKALATRVGSSQSRIAKMEANDPSVSLDLLITSLVGLGVSLKDLGRIMGTKQPRR
jgi:DNA-binding XRE family transcriptional regulator